jgi:hypothetical protein
MQETFNRDLKAGKGVEHEVCNHLKKRYPDTYVVDGYCKEWDIVIPEIGRTVEVKQDEKSNFTGNFLIEIEFGGKPSALSTSKADWYILVDKNYYYIVQTDILRWLVRDYLTNEYGELYTPASFVGAGDITPKRAYLIPKDRLVNSGYIRVANRPSKPANTFS